jgi:hypothetical protein
MVYGKVYGINFTKSRGLRMNAMQVALIRAFGDEPRKLRAASEGSMVMVFGPEGDESIPYPSAFVYEFEDQLFSDLAAAYGRGDQSNLSALWQRARPLKHPSN